MNYIRGKFKQMIFESENGYKVGLFQVKETEQEEMKEQVNKTITFTGYFADINNTDYYKLYAGYRQDYHISELLSGKLDSNSLHDSTIMAQKASSEEKLTVCGLLL